MGLILSIVMLLAGYVVILSSVTRHLSDRSSRILAAVVLLVIYGGASATLLCLLSMMGLLENGSLLVTILMGILSLAAVIVFLLRHGREIRKGFFLLFILNVLVLFIICIFSRFGSIKTEVNTDALGTLTEAIKQESFEPLSHFFLNMLLFMPTGVLLPLICPHRINRMILVIMPAALLSCMIECLQMVFFLGNCDIEDVIANVMGAILGFIFLRFFFALEGEETMED